MRRIILKAILIIAAIFIYVLINDSINGSSNSPVASPILFILLSGFIFGVVAWKKKDKKNESNDKHILKKD